MKACKKCGVEKPLTDFSADKRLKDGRLSTCRKCEYAKKKARQAKRPTETENMHVKRRQWHTAVMMTEKQAKRIKDHGYMAESKPSEYRAVGTDEDRLNAAARRALEDRAMVRQPSQVDYYFGRT